jgi:hypothetical protein
MPVATGNRAAQVLPETGGLMAMCLYFRLFSGFYMVL